jgi:hypothetical protein
MRQLPLAHAAEQGAPVCHVSGASKNKQRPCAAQRCREGGVPAESHRVPETLQGHFGVKEQQGACFPVPKSCV